VFALLASVSWQRWIDPYVDTGRELMVPSRVAHGERLYRDVRFYYGPLAPWIAAGVEKTGDPSLPRRVLLATAVALLNIEALRRLAGRMAKPAAASLLVSLAVAIAFFLPPGGCHLFPYSLDSSLALAALTWALVLAADPAREGAPQRREWLAGACVFATLLARPEYGVATAGVLCLARDGWRRGRLLRLLLVPLGAAAVVYAVASLGTPLHVLATEGWLTVVFAPPEFRTVYASFAGLDRPAFRLAELALAGIVVAIAGAFLAACAFASARSRSRGGRIAVGLFAAAVLAVAAFLAFAPPASLAESLGLLPPLVRIVPPLVLALGIARAAGRLMRRELLPSLAAIPDPVLYMAALFSARIFLAAGYVGPYPAFFLPLVVVVCGASLFTFAARADRSLDPSGAAAPLSPLVAAALLVFLAFRVADRARVYRSGPWSRVETPAGALVLREPIAGTTTAALRALSSLVPRGRPVAGFPEAGFFQYVLGYSNPLPADQFFPGHLDAAAERDTVARLEARPPDAVILANVRTGGFGKLALGRDYLTELGRELDTGFPPLVSFGPGARADARVGDPDFFVEIRVRRRAGTAEPPEGVTR
jgi:hypothetical protein